MKSHVVAEITIHRVHDMTLPELSRLESWLEDSASKIVELGNELPFEHTHLYLMSKDA